VSNKSYRAPQKPKQYQPRIEREKSFKIRNPTSKKLKPKHIKEFYDNESIST